MADKMAGQKELSDRDGDCASSSLPVKCQLSVNTFKRWQEQYEKEHSSLSWLRCDQDQPDKTLVSALRYEMCRKYEARIRGQKNFSKAWIEGTNPRTSNVLDRANSSQHKAAMSHYQRDQAKAHGEQV